MTSRLLRTRPTLGVRDVPMSIAFYERTLGFTVETTMGEPPDFALLARDGVGLGLVAADPPAVAAFACAYYDVEDVIGLHDAAVAGGATLASPLTRHPWGNHDFVVQDPDGHLLAFGERA
jgi:catechol 2,3-dioxygenase-like lactoylglutathione lyase family enzyme